MTEKIERESMVFYESFYDAIKDLSPEEFKACTCAIMNYGFDGIIPECKGLVKSLFTLVKPQIDKNIRRYEATVENGRKGGAPKGNTNRKKAMLSTETNQTSTRQNQPSAGINLYDNDNVYDNDNANDNVYDNANENDNDYDNVNVDDRAKKEPAKAGPNILTLGEYENVLISATEMANLICELGHDVYTKSVEHLSRYLKRKPEYRSACHYEDLRGWVQDALKKEDRGKNAGTAASPDVQAKLDHFGITDFEDIFETP